MTMKQYRLIRDLHLAVLRVRANRLIRQADSLARRLAETEAMADYLNAQARR